MLSDQPLTTGSTSHLGEADPALKVTTFGEIARRAARVEHIQASWQPGRDLMPAMRSGDRSRYGPSVSVGRSLWERPLEGFHLRASHQGFKCL